MRQEKAVYTIREISAMYCFPEWGLRTLVKKGDLPVIKCGNRTYLTKQTIEDYLRSGGRKLETARG